MAELNTVYFAKTNFRGHERIFGIKTADRRQHTYVVGKTGTGKTSLIKNMAIQDIYAGRGLCVVDPHGELVEELLEKVPASRMNDVIYFNPADTDFPLGFNVLEVPDPQYKHLIAQGLIGIFTKIWANVWSARMEYILQNCILALIETPGTTLLGVQRILTDRDFRQRIVTNISDPVVKAFWLNEFEAWEPRFRNEAIVPIQNKVGQFLSTALVRNIIGQEKSSFDVYELMNSQKILLANISKGRIGEENSALLGAMLITKIQLAAMERVRIPEDERRDFYLYVDEFQNFATEAFASILSEARKYRLNLIIAHQYVGQLVSETTTKVRDAVFGNVGTMIAFRVGATDAEFLEKEFTPEFVIEDLINLPNYNIYLKLMVNGVTSRPFSALTIPPIAATEAMAGRDKIIDASRAAYARPVLKVEEEIMRWSATVPGLVNASAEPSPTNFFSRSPAIKAPAERFETPCSICGKPAFTPFKPDGRRPVYCSECLKKIEAGELRPLRPLPPEKERKETEGKSEEFGTEFEKHPARSESRTLPAPVAHRPVPTDARTPVDRGSADRLHSSHRLEMHPRMTPHIREGEIVARRPEPKTRTLSLDELKARAQRTSEKRETDRSELRQMIQETLKKDEIAQAPEKAAAPSPDADSKSEFPHESAPSRPINPGESIKF